MKFWWNSLMLGLILANSYATLRARQLQILAATHWEIKEYPFSCLTQCMTCCSTKISCLEKASSTMRHSLQLHCHLRVSTGVCHPALFPRAQRNKGVHTNDLQQRATLLICPSQSQSHWKQTPPLAAQATAVVWTILHIAPFTLLKISKTRWAALF